jgi:surfeit locus 1 family protein
MLSKARSAKLVWPTVLAVLGLAVLLGLGTWQMQRRQWKETLIQKIAQRVHAPPVRLAADGRPQGATSDDLEYLRVTASGRFHHEKERFLYAPGKAGLGWHLYTPLELAEGRFVWVNRGFVPDARKDPATRRQSQPEGRVEVTGLVRAAQPVGMFTPANDVAHNIWYWPDAPAMQASAFDSAAPPPLSFTIDADASADPTALPQGGTTRVALPNRHLEYALTWYGLALTLIGVYAAFAAGRLRAT